MEVRLPLGLFYVLTFKIRIPRLFFVNGNRVFIFFLVK